MEKQFKTSDIVLAATLKEKGFNLDKIELSGNKGVFLFENVDSGVITDFDLGKISVEPVSFNNAIKTLTTSVRRVLN